MAASGARTRFVTVQQRTTVAAPGYPVETWTLLGRFHMSRKDDSGFNTAERFTGAQASASQLTTWQMPYVPTMDPESVDVPATRRLIFQARTYDIQSAARVVDGIALVTLVGTAVA